MTDLYTETSAEQWLHNADDDVLACRGAGRHSFDKLHRNRPLPNTHTVPFSRQGVVAIVQTCPDCRCVERMIVTAQRGQIDLPTRWSYKRLDSKYTAPKGVKITPRMALAEEVRRINEDGGFR